MKHRFVLPITASAALGLFLFAAAGSFSAPAFAQANSVDTQALLDRVDRLQRDLNALQRRVYQGGGTPAQGSGSPGTPPVQGASATDLEVRLENIEEQLQSLRGAIEQANYQNKAVQDRLDKLSSDVSFRLDALEKKVGINAGSGALPSGSGAGPSNAATAPPPAENGPQPRVLGQVPADSGSNAPGAASASPPPGSAPLIPDEANAAPAVKLPAGSPKEQYAYAFGLLNQNNYAGGEKALREFVEAHPNDPLAGNAQYWLGRTYYARNDFADAVRTFAEGYQKYPKNQYAAENLLYLGRSLTGLNRKTDACATYTRLLREYPQISQATKNSVAAERKKLACS